MALPAPPAPGSAAPPSAAAVPAAACLVGAASGAPVPGCLPPCPGSLPLSHAGSYAVGALGEERAGRGQPCRRWAGGHGCVAVTALSPGRPSPGWFLRSGKLAVVWAPEAMIKNPKSGCLLGSLAGQSRQVTICRSCQSCGT